MREWRQGRHQIHQANPRYKSRFSVVVPLDADDYTNNVLCGDCPLALAHDGDLERSGDAAIGQLQDPRDRMRRPLGAGQWVVIRRPDIAATRAGHPHDVAQPRPRYPSRARLVARVLHDVVLTCAAATSVRPG